MLRSDNRTFAVLFLMGGLCVAGFVSACGMRPATRNADSVANEAKSASEAKKTTTPYLNSTYKFSLTLPAGYEHPEENFEMEATAKGTIYIPEFSWGGDFKGAGTCGVLVYIFPEPLIKSKKPKDVLDIVVRAKSNNSAVEQMESLTVQGFPAVSYRTSITDEKGLAYARELFVYTAGYLYRVNFFTENRARLDAPEIEDFFKSFHIDQLTAEERLKHLDLVREKAAGETQKELDQIAKATDERRGSVSTSNEVVNTGNLNAKAIELPKPVYPPVARAVKASGDVELEVTVDEKGAVVSANAISGHSLLRVAAAAAARQARFNPETRDGKPVKMKGTLVYTFQ